MAVTAPPPVGTASEAPELGGPASPPRLPSPSRSAWPPPPAGPPPVGAPDRGHGGRGAPPPRPSPAAQQRLGRARLLQLMAQDRTALRRAYFDVYLRGGAAATSRDARPEDAVILKGTVFYGEVAGPDPGADTFWAVGPVYVKGPHGDSDHTVPQVWKRDDGGPWVHVGAGPAGGCVQVPALWQRSPCPP